jgi:hypothetical protein
MRRSWRRSAVMDWYSASDHFYIMHVFGSRVRRAAVGPFVYTTKQIEADSFVDKFDCIYESHILRNDESACGERLQSSLERTCAEDLKKKFPSRVRRRSNYWWNDELVILKSATFRSRRRAPRAVAACREDAAFLLAEYKSQRRSLKRAIERSKEECWKRFCATLDQDPWGRPYRVMRSRLMRSTPPEPLSRDRVVRILDDLFVTRGQSWLIAQEIESALATLPDGDEDLLIDNEDLKMAVGRCDPRKAAGVDGIPGVLVRLLAEKRANVLLGVLNGVNSGGRIPAVWKVARVVLIPKPNRDLTTSSAYRPISILPALSKIWAHTLKMLIERSVGRDPFHKDQFGFRRRRRDGVIRRSACAGVPQGSVLGPLLWNLVYDGVLKMLDREKDLEAVAFADDLAVLLKVRESSDIEERIRTVIGMTTRWCCEAGLHLSMEKTEVILLTRKRIPVIFNFDVGVGGGRSPLEEL